MDTAYEPTYLWCAKFSNCVISVCQLATSALCFDVTRLFLRNAVKDSCYANNTLMTQSMEINIEQAIREIESETVTKILGEIGLARCAAAKVI